MSCIRIWESSVLLSADNACVCVREMDYCSPAPPSYNVAKISVVSQALRQILERHVPLWHVCLKQHCTDRGRGGKKREGSCYWMSATGCRVKRKRQYVYQYASMQSHTHTCSGHTGSRMVSFTKLTKFEEKIGSIFCAGRRNPSTTAYKPLRQKFNTVLMYNCIAMRKTFLDWFSC